MPKFEIFSRTIVTTRFTAVTDTVAHAKSLFLRDEATQQDFTTDETLAAWIVGPDGAHHPLDEIEEVFTFPLSAALGGGKIVVSATSKAEALAKVDHEIAKLAAGTAPPPPKSVAIKSSAESVSIPVRDTTSNEQTADTWQAVGEVYAVDQDGPVRNLAINASSGTILVSFVPALPGRYDISVNGDLHTIYRFHSKKRRKLAIDGVPGVKNLVSIDFTPDEPGALTQKGITFEVTLPPIPAPSNWSKPSEAAPLAFSYLRVKPCLENYDGDIDSFNSEEERDEALKAYVFQIPRTFYSLYGVVDDGREIAIGDFTTKSGAIEVMNAILAPMAKARDRLVDACNRSDKSLTVGVAVNVIDEAAKLTSADLDDFINQCSNGERL